jgi:glutamate-ammonia-ligase adenylyltransferase
LRNEVLARDRDAAGLVRDIVGMRRRMRGELDRSRAPMFDLKQGEGGLVDLEFLLQFLVLREAVRHPALLVPRATPLLVDALGEAAVLSAQVARGLHEAHAALADAGLRCTLDRRPRIVGETAAIAAARAAVQDALQAQGLDFS